MAPELIINLEGRAGGYDEGASHGGVSQTARVSGVSTAGTSVVVEGGTAETGGGVNALALASDDVVGLTGGARGDDKGAIVAVVGQTALVSGESRALACCGVPSGTAEASLDGAALALADGVVGELGGQAQRRVDALAVALAVVLLVARALVGALALAGGGVVHLVDVGAGGVHADLGGVTKLEGSSADAVTAVVVVVGALRGDQSALAVGGADGVAGLKSGADTAVCGIGAAAGGGDAPVGGVAEGGASGAGQDARPVVSGGDVVVLADQAEELSGQRSASLVNDAEGDEGQASLPVTGGEVAGAADRASAVQGHEDLAVGDDGPTLLTVRGQLVVGGATGTNGGDGSIVLVDVGQAELDVADAVAGIVAQVVAGEADSAEVLVSDVGQAEGDVDQAEVAVDGQPGKVGVALNAEAQAVVLQAVADASGDTTGPVSGLSETVGAVGAQVCSGDVGQAVSNGGQANTIDEHGGVVASQADGAGGSSGVVDASGHHGYDDADGVQTEEVALNAFNAVTVGVDGLARGDSAANAVAVDEVVKLDVIA